MFSSRNYWNQRYTRGGNSGNGSYNNNAIFKAEILNKFIKNKNINTLIDFGVGDGNQLKYIDTQNLKYIGIDISEFVISKCKAIFNNDTSKTFILDTDITNTTKSELVISCDVIYHLVEDEVYRKYMKKLFFMSEKYVIIYAKDEEIELARHVKFRKFTKYIQNNFPNWKLIQHIPNKYPQINLKADNSNTSPSDFYIYKKENYDENKHRESALITEPANINRIKYITEILNKLKLKEGSRILDFGGNQFQGYCNRNNFIYQMLDLEQEQKNGDGGYFPGGHTYNGRDIPFKKNSFDVIIISFVLHHTSSNCIYLLQQLKEITTNYLIICEDLCGIEYPIKWHERCFYHQKEGIFRGDEEWKYLFNSLELNLIDTLNLRCARDLEFSDPYDHIYRIQYTLSKKTKSNLFIQNKKVPIYVSLTSIFQNQDLLIKTLKSIKNQTLKPDKVFCYLSEDPYLLDTGFSNKIISNLELKNFINENKEFEIVWVKNTGSYRKLLPLLKEKWNEDCIIITIDDDAIYDSNLIETAIDSYNENKCVVGFRGFTPKINEIKDFNYTKRDNIKERHKYNFLTGLGSILYKPSFFHKTGEVIFDESIYLKYCNKQDDIWFYILRIMNKIDSVIILDKKWCIKNLNSDMNRPSLFKNFNRFDNLNTTVFKEIWNLLN